MDAQPDARRKVIFQHPTLTWLQVVVWEGSMAAMLRRLDYAEVIEPADELPEETMREDEE